MSELIGGKEAFDAAYNGDEAQWRWTGKDVEWRELKGTTSFSIDELKGGVCEFRLKPRTVNLNGVEVPSVKYVAHSGGNCVKISCECPEDAAAIGAALRSIFNPQ